MEWSRIGPFRIVRRPFRAKPWEVWKGPAFVGAFSELIEAEEHAETEKIILEYKTSETPQDVKLWH